MHAQVVRIKGRGAARLAGILAALVMALTAVFVLPSAANAADEAGDCSPLWIDSLNWGGTYWCDYDWVSWSNPDDSAQVFVVAGPKYNVWTRWRNARGGLSGWVNLGGNVYSANGVGSVESLDTSGRGDERALKVLGTDQHSWCNIRESDGTWTGWQGSQSCGGFVWETPVL